MLKRHVFWLVIKKLPFNIYAIDIYLYEKIKASPLYYFNKLRTDVIIRLDNIEYGRFFACRETADF